MNLESLLKTVAVDVQATINNAYWNQEKDSDADELGLREEVIGALNGNVDTFLLVVGHNQGSGYTEEVGEIVVVDDNIIEYESESYIVTSAVDALMAILAVEYDVSRTEVPTATSSRGGRKDDFYMALVPE